MRAEASRSPRRASRGQDVVVGQMGVDDVEALRRIVSRRARTSRGMPEGPWVRERSGRAQPAGSRRSASGLPADERELRLDPGVAQGPRPVVDDRGDPGPLLAGDDVEDAHGE